MEKLYVEVQWKMLIPSTIRFSSNFSAMWLDSEIYKMNFFFDMRLIRFFCRNPGSHRPQSRMAQEKLDFPIEFFVYRFDCCYRLHVAISVIIMEYRENFLNFKNGNMLLSLLSHGSRCCYGN